MNTNLKAIAARYASALKASEVFTTDPEDRPTATDIWLWKLEDAVWNNVQYPSRSKDEEYNPHTLYAHRACLKSKEDVEKAPDDVLLEALGLGTVKGWGWLQFMVREGNWFALLAANWGLPGLLCEYGGNANAEDQAAEEERRAQAALYFLDLMRERGLDPLSEVQSLVDKIKGKLKGSEFNEEVFREWLRGYHEWAYFVYTCQSVVIRSGKAGGVAYVGDHRAQFRSQIRTAAERRRQNWNNAWSCDCQKGNPITDE